MENNLPPLGYDIPVNKDGAEAVINLCQVLSGQCDRARTRDGVGFAKSDVTLGHEIGLWTVEGLLVKPVVLFAAATMVKRYSKTQLNADEFAPVEAYLESRRLTRPADDIYKDGRETIKASIKARKDRLDSFKGRSINPADNEGGFLVKWDKGRKDVDHAAMLDAIRKVPGRKYLGEVEGNFIPVTPRTLEAVKAFADVFAPRWAVKYDDEAADNVVGQIHLRESIQRAEADEAPVVYSTFAAKVVVNSKGARRLVLDVPKFGEWWDQGGQYFRPEIKRDLGFQFRNAGQDKANPNTWQGPANLTTWESLQAFFARFDLVLDADASVDAYFGLLLKARDLTFKQAAPFADKDLPGTLRPYQVTGAQWLRDNRIGLLTDEMGTGKTIQVAAALPANAKAVIVVPASLRQNWLNELAIWRPDLKAIKGTIHNLDHKDADNVIPLGLGADVVVLSYTAVGGLDPADLASIAARFKAIAAGGHQLVIVADEVATCKNPEAARSKGFSALVSLGLEHNAQVWGLDGYPQVNTELDLWCVMDALGIAEASWGSEEKFVKAWGGTITESYAKGAKRGGMRNAIRRYNFEPKDQNDEAIQDALSVATLGRNRRDVLPDLPRKTRVRSAQVLDAHTARDVKIKLGILLMSEAKARAFRAVERRLIRDDFPSSEEVVLNTMTQADIDKAHGEIQAFLSSDKTHANELAAESAEDFSFGGLMMQIRKMLAVAKAELAVDEAVNQLVSGNGPVAIFSASTTALKRAREYAEDLGYGCNSIVGGMSDKQKNKAVEDFQAGRLDMLFGNIKAAGRGLTLTNADTMIFIDWSYSDADNKQAEDRICRMGQESSKCLYIDMILDHWIDHGVAAKCNRKAANHAHLDDNRSLHA